MSDFLSTVAGGGGNIGGGDDTRVVLNALVRPVLDLVGPSTASSELGGAISNVVVRRIATAQLAAGSAAAVGAAAALATPAVSRLRDTLSRMMHVLGFHVPSVPSSAENGRPGLDLVLMCQHMMTMPTAAAASTASRAWVEAVVGLARHASLARAAQLHQLRRLRLSAAAGSGEGGESQSASGGDRGGHGGGHGHGHGHSGGDRMGRASPSTNVGASQAAQASQGAREAQREAQRAIWLLHRQFLLELRSIVEGTVERWLEPNGVVDQVVETEFGAPMADAKPSAAAAAAAVAGGDLASWTVRHLAFLDENPSSLNANHVMNSSPASVNPSGTDMAAEGGFDSLSVPSGGTDGYKQLCTHWGCLSARPTILLTARLVKAVVASAAAAAAEAAARQQHTVATASAAAAAAIAQWRKGGGVERKKRARESSDDASGSVYGGDAAGGDTIGGGGDIRDLRVPRAALDTLEQLSLRAARTHGRDKEYSCSEADIIGGAGAAVHVSGMNEADELITLVFQLSRFTSADGTGDDTSLAWRGLWWQACRIGVVLSASAPDTIGRWLWLHTPTVRGLLQMAVTGDWIFPARGVALFAESSPMDETSVAKWGPVDREGDASDETGGGGTAGADAVSRRRCAPTTVSELARTDCFLASREQIRSTLALGGVKAAREVWESMREPAAPGLASSGAGADGLGALPPLPPLPPSLAAVLSGSKLTAETEAGAAAEAEGGAGRLDGAERPDGAAAGIR